MWRMARSVLLVVALLAAGVLTGSGQQRGASQAPRPTFQIDPAKADKGFVELAKRGDLYRINAAGKIEPVKVNVRQLHARQINRGQIRASVDYTLFEDHGPSVDLRVEAVGSAGLVTTIAPQTVRVHEGYGTAVVTLDVGKDAKATTTALRFSLVSGRDQRVFYTRDFPFQKTWTYDAPSGGRRMPARPTLRFVKVQASARHTLELALYCAAGPGTANVELIGEALDRKQATASAITFSGPAVTADGGGCPAHFALSGDKTVRTTSIRLKLVSGSSTLAQLDLPVAKTWRESLAQMAAGYKVVKGTVVRNVYPDNFEVKGEDGVLYYVTFNALEDYYGWDPGDAIHVGGYAPGAPTSLMNAWHVGEGYTVAGSVAGLACSGANPSIAVKESATGNLFRIRFSDADVCGGFAMHDLVEINGTVRPVGSGIVRNPTVQYHYHPVPRALTMVASTDLEKNPMLALTGFNLMAQINTSLIQAFLNDYYQDNAARFTSGTLRVEKPAFIVWTRGANQTGLRVTARDGSLSATLEVSFTLSVDPKSIRLDFSAAEASLNVDDGDASRTTGLNRLSSGVTSLFKTIGRIDLPFELVSDFFPVTAVTVPGNVRVLLNQFSSAGIQVRATSTSGEGWVFVGLNYGLGGTTLGRASYFLNDFYLDYSNGNTVTLAVAPDLLAGLVGEMLKPVQTYEIKPTYVVNTPPIYFPPYAGAWADEIPRFPAMTFPISLGILDSLECSFSGATLTIDEALVDFYQMDILTIPDCGEWTTATYERPTASSPGRPGYRCHTHGARLENWKLHFAVTQKNGKPFIGIDNVTKGTAIDRGMLGMDFSSLVDVSLLLGIGLIVPEVPLPGLSKTLAGGALNGITDETYFWFAMK